AAKAGSETSTRAAASLRIGQASQNKANESLASSPRAEASCPRAFLEEGDDALFGLLGAAAGFVDQVHGQDRVALNQARRGIGVVELDGLELVAEGALVGLEAFVGHQFVALEAQADRREILLGEALARAIDLVRRDVDGALAGEGGRRHRG